MILQCPTVAQLRTFLANGTLRDSSSEFISHVSDCTECQCALDQLSHDPALRYWTDKLVNTVDDIATAGRDRPPPNYYLPAQIGPYHIERELGRGGMGVVYLANDEVLNRLVALKLIRRDALKPETRERFVREVRAAARIQHSHVVSVYAAGETEDDGSPYLVMEFVAGPTLAALIREQRQLRPRTAVAFAVQIAAGLATAHAAGLVHRDVKPANVLISTGPSNDAIAKLADFGMVRDEAESGLTTSGAIAGTPAYLSPEQARGEAVDARCDVYGLGVTLYEMLTGEPPFRGPPHQVLRQILDDEPRPLRQIDNAIPVDIETIVLKSLAKEPSRRYPSINDFGADLQRWLDDKPIYARPVGRIARTWRWCRRNPKLATMTGLAMSALLALAVGGATAAMVVNRAYQRAEKSRIQAESDYELAIKSFITLVDGVQKQMGNQPGLLPLKRKLLETAADGLKQTIHDPTDTSKTDDMVSLAHLSLGNVLIDLGRSTEGKQEFETAVRHGEGWVQRLPNDIKALRAVAGPSDRLGDIARYANQPEAARDWYTKAKDCRARIAQLIPADKQAQRDISISRGKIGDVFGETDHWQSARQHFEEALRITEGLESGDDRIRWLTDLRFCRNRLSDACTELGDMKAADAQAMLALGHAQELAVLDRHTGLIERAFAVDRLARVAARCFDAKRSVELRQESLALRREIAASDPGNIAATRYIGYALHYLGGAHAAAGDYAAARTTLDEAIKVFADSVKDDADSGQWTLNLKIAFDSAIGNEENDGQYAGAAALCTRLIDVCRHGEANPHLVSLKLDVRRTEAERDLAAFRYAAAQSLSDANPIPAELDNVRRKVLRLRAWDIARKGKDTEAIAAVAILDQANDADDALMAARIFAKVNRVEDSVRALKLAVGTTPELTKDLHLVAEFYLLRDRPAFQAFREELFARARR